MDVASLSKPVCIANIQVLKKEIGFADHKLSSTKFVPSPNFNQRPEGVQIDTLVIHNISLPAKCYGGDHIEQLFINNLNPNDDPSFEAICNLKVSSHLLIRRDGEIVQFVAFDYRAWHAGVSRLGERDACNDFSIGIELEGSDDDPFMQSQYESLVAVTDLLFENYPGLDWSRVVGHQDIAPGRKTDPGPYFDWHLYRSLFESVRQA